MEYVSKSGDTDTIIDNIEMLRKDYTHYYNSLSIDELEPCKVVICSYLHKNELHEDILLLYSSNLIILKKLISKVSKKIIQYTDINYIISEGMPDPFCITIHYNLNEEEKLYFEPGKNDIINSLLFDLRRLVALKIEDDIGEIESNISLYDLEKDKYIGATITKDVLMKEQSVICSIKQRTIYSHGWSILRKIISKTHYTVLCNDEIVIFLERTNSKSQQNNIGDLIFIPIKALKCTSIEATGKGMIMRYQFSDSKYELFYENEQTDDLLKIMSYINGKIAK